MESSVTYTSSERARAYLGGTLGYLFDGYNLLLTTFLFAGIAATFHAGLSQVALAVTFALVGSVIGGIFFGWLADKTGRRTTLLLTILVFAIFEILSGFSNSLPLFYVFQFIVGLGVGGEWGVGFSLVNETWGNKRRGLAGGFLQSTFVIGALLGAQTAGFFNTAFGLAEGWRYSYFFVGGISLLLLILRVVMPESKTWLVKVGKLRSGGEELAPVSPLRELFSKEYRKWTALGTILVFGFMLYFYSGQTFYPTLFRDLGAGPSITLIITLGSIAGIIAEVFIGYANDLLGRKKAGIIFGVISLLVIFPFLYEMYHPVKFSAIGSFPAFYAYILLYFFQASYAALFGVWLGEHFATRLRATGSNFCYMVGRGIGGGLAPIIVPALITSSVTLGQAMSFVMIIGAVIMLVGAFGLKETSGVDTSKF
ncbi:MFS transporter [Thermoplasmatales archaeon AK]|nr:MFS transporter [Thermoplasmatales archaeon AK]